MTGVWWEIERQWHGGWYPGTGYVDHVEGQQYRSDAEARGIIRALHRRNIKYGWGAREYRVIEVSRKVVE